jgi:hypothetical protein
MEICEWISNWVDKIDVVDLLWNEILSYVNGPICTELWSSMYVMKSVRRM